MGAFSIAVGTAGNLGLPGRGPISWEEMGERTPGGGGSSPGTPFSGGGCGGGCTSYEIPGLRPSLCHAGNGPPTGSGGREKWFVDGRRKRETKRLLSAFSQRVPTHVPSPPSRWAGRYGPFNVRAAGQVTSEKYNLPPHNPTREGSPEEGTSFPLVFFPLFLQRNRAPPGRAPFPAVPTAPGKNPSAPTQTKAVENAPSPRRP